MINDTIYDVNINFQKYERLLEPDPNFDYTKYARDCIATFADTIYPHLSTEMLKSDDAIAEIAYCVMLGDMKWKEGGGMKLNSWRTEQAKLGMKKYVNRKNRKQKVPSCTIEPLLATSGQPINYLERYDEQEHATIEVNKIIAGSGLTDKEAEAAKLRSAGYTYAQIGNQLHCSDENARLLNNKALEKMREYVGVKIST